MCSTLREVRASGDRDKEALQFDEGFEKKVKVVQDHFRHHLLTQPAGSENAPLGKGHLSCNLGDEGEFTRKKLLSDVCSHISQCSIFPLKTVNARVIYLAVHSTWRSLSTPASTCLRLNSGYFPQIIFSPSLP